MKLDDTLFERLLDDAQKSPRKRSHHNLHDSFGAPVQRLCIALLKDTYVRPHYHSQENKWEMMLALRGSVGVLHFDHTGIVQKRFELSQNGSLTGLEIVPGTWHAVFPLTDTAILLEVKEGPYCPLEPDDFAAWAPAEGDSKVALFLKWAETASVEDAFLQGTA